MHDYWKITGLIIQTFVGQVMCLLFNMLSSSSKEQASFNFMVAQLCECTKNHWVVHIKLVNCIAEYVTAAMKLKDTCSLEEKL